MFHDLIRILMHHRGKGNEISAAALLLTMNQQGANLSGLPDLRALVHSARLNGNLIASNDAGYFLPSNLNEAMEFIDDRLRHPAGDQMHTARVLRNLARRQFGGQLGMWS